MLKGQREKTETVKSTHTELSSENLLHFTFMEENKYFQLTHMQTLTPSLSYMQGKT